MSGNPKPHLVIEAGWPGAAVAAGRTMCIKEKLAGPACKHKPQHFQAAGILALKPVVV